MSGTRTPSAAAPAGPEVALGAAAPTQFFIEDYAPGDIGIMGPESMTKFENLLQGVLRRPLHYEADFYHDGDFAPVQLPIREAWTYQGPFADVSVFRWPVSGMSGETSPA